MSKCAEWAAEIEESEDMQLYQKMLEEEQEEEWYLESMATEGEEALKVCGF